MAGIDKTYIDTKEYPRYRQWWIDNYEKMMKERGRAVWLYPFSAFYKGMYCPNITPELLLSTDLDIEYVGVKMSREIIIWNTSEGWDKWLINNCDIPSYQARMRDVYGYNWEGFGKNKPPKPYKKERTRRRNVFGYQKTYKR